MGDQIVTAGRHLHTLTGTGEQNGSREESA